MPLVVADHLISLVAGKAFVEIGAQVSCRANVLETLLTAQTRLVLQTATHRRQKRNKHADRHEHIDARKSRLEHRAGWG